MTTLNTIIEEEKKGAKESILETFEDGTIRYCPRDLETKITTAMQRAYEAGKEEDPLKGERRRIIEQIRDERDTYWKERVRKEVEGMKVWFEEEDYCKTFPLISKEDLLDNLK